MTSVVVAQPRTEAPIFQWRLIPEGSELVGHAMQKAAVWGNSDNFLVARLGPTVLVIAALAMSVINTVSYALGIPIQMLQNIVFLDPKRLVMDFGKGFFNVGRSFIFITLGPTLILGGLLIPSQIFSFFAPEYVGSEIDRVKRENAMLLKQRDAWKKNAEGFEEDLYKATNRVVKLEGEMEELKDLNRKQKAGNSQWKIGLGSFFRGIAALPKSTFRHMGC